MFPSGHTAFLQEGSSHHSVLGTGDLIQLSVLQSLIQLYPEASSYWPIVKLSEILGAVY